MKKLASLLGVLSVLAVLFLVISHVIAGPKIPLSSDINIVPPDSSLPEEIRALSGRWEGKMGKDRIRKVILIIEKIDRDKAQVVIVWDYVYIRSGYPEGWSREEFKVSLRDGEVLLSGETLRFLLRKDKPNILEIWSVWIIGMSGTLKKVD